jgi:DNA primase
MLEEAVAMYENNLAGDEAAVRYLVADRGLPLEVAQRVAVTNRLGVVGTENYAPGHSKYRGMMCIPYLDKDGNPLTVRFRCMQKHDHGDYFHGKYMSLPEDHPRLYNIRAIHEAESILHACEGEFDAMVLNAIGLHAIAIPGASLWGGSFRRMLAGFNRVYLWADGDDAGAELTNKITRSLRTAMPVKLPRNSDVNAIYADGGAEALLALIEEK